MILQLLIAILACRINRYQDHFIAYLHEKNRVLKATRKVQRRNLTAIPEKKRLWYK